MLKGHKSNCSCFICKRMRGEKIVHRSDCKCFICNAKRHGNKGKNNPFYGRKHTQETRDHLSKVHPDVSGKNSPSYGIKSTQETRDKISIAKTGVPNNHSKNCHCPWCDKKGKKNPFYGKNHTLETRIKISIFQTGNEIFDGFITHREYGEDFTKELCKQIRERDNHICEVCKTKENGRRHDVHHIDYDKKNNSPENLITLCMVCHRRTNFNREIWCNLLKEYQDYRFGGASYEKN